MFRFSILVFLPISERFPPSLIVQALKVVMQVLLSSSHTSREFLFLVQSSSAGLSLGWDLAWSGLKGTVLARSSYHALTDL